MSSIWIALNKIQRNTDELLKEHRALCNHYKELQKSLEFHINNVESLETENKALKKDIASLKQTVRHTDEKIAELNVDLNGVNKDLCTAINQIDDLEQYTRKHNLETHGIPETHEEHIPEKIIKLGKILNIHISNNDIDIWHRMATRRSNSDPRPIIVRFKSYRAKTELYRARKLLKSVSLKNISIIQRLFTSMKTLPATGATCLPRLESLERTISGIAPGPLTRKFLSENHKVIK